MSSLWHFQGASFLFGYYRLEMILVLYDFIGFSLVWQLFPVMFEGPCSPLLLTILFMYLWGWCSPKSPPSVDWGHRRLQHKPQRWLTFVACDCWSIWWGRQWGCNLGFTEPQGQAVCHVCPFCSCSYWLVPLSFHLYVLSISGSSSNSGPLCSFLGYCFSVTPQIKGCSFLTVS